MTGQDQDRLTITAAIARIAGIHRKEREDREREEFEIIKVPRRCIPKGAKLVEAYETQREIVVMGDPPEDDDMHDCDALGCGSLGHVLYRFQKEAK